METIGYVHERHEVIAYDVSGEMSVVGMKEAKVELAQEYRQCRIKSDATIHHKPNGLRVIALWPGLSQLTAPFQAKGHGTRDFLGG